jgi:uncharacterized protein
MAVALATAALAAPTSGIPPAPTRWVTDEPGFLSTVTREALNLRLESFEAATGHQVIVWIGRTIGNETLETWAARTFTSWGIGRKGKDDGVALFILTDDRKARIEVGYGLEGQLPDIEAARIIRDELTARLRAGDPNGGVTAAVDGMLAAIGGEKPGGRQPVAPQTRQLGWGELLFLGVLGLFVLGFLITHPTLAVYLLTSLLSGGGRRGGGFGGFGGGGGGGGGGGFTGGGGRSGGGGASGSW